ncbi:MAG: response regulator [Armatimonadota bacterium]|nr:response regulator [bacterium]
MRAFRDIPIKSKLIAITMLVSCVVLLLACAGILVQESFDNKKIMVRDVSTQAKIVGDNSTAALAFFDHESAREILNALQAKTNIVSACLYDSKGKQFVRYFRSNKGLALIPKSPGKEGARFVNGNLIVFRRVRLDNKPIGTIYIESDTLQIQANMRRFVTILSIAMLISIFVAFLMASRFQRIISEPILCLAGISKAVSIDKNYSVRAVKCSGDEIGTLIDCFNEMLSCVQQRDAELETRVAERTAEVEARNKQLNDEIAERKRAQAALSASEERFRIVGTSMHDGAIVVDEAGNVSFWNEAAQRIFGYTSDEIIGKSCHAILAPHRFHEAIDKAFADFAATGSGSIVGRDSELIGLRKDGSEFPIEMSLSAVQVKGRWHSIGIIRDITKRKEVENEITRAKEAAEAASRAKSEFLANMSHEIRTPLNGIVGMTGLALDTDLAVDQREYLEIVKVSAEALLSLLNDILDFSKIEARKLELNPVPFTLRECVQEIISSLAVKAHEKHLELACRVMPGVADDFVGDTLRLRQIIVNLVGNALKFTDRGEVVVLVDSISQTESEATLHFSISDTGIGIPKDKQNQIFSAFEQGDGSTTRKYGGTGLGLAIASELTRMMGGRIWVESEVGRGSTFHFTVIFGIGEKTTESMPLELEGVHVLVVDDNATNRIILEEILSRWHMRPVLAECGDAAIAAMEIACQDKDPFLLVLLDSHMPEVDGFAVADRIRTNESLADTTLIMLTSGEHFGDIAKCQEKDIKCYLIKPIKNSELRNKITLALGGGLPTKNKCATTNKEGDMEVYHHLRILLVEDNQINQKLAQRLLEKHGHSVVLANDGRQAVAFFENEMFDSILMDVQMPEMDGIQATSAIRALEKGTSRHVPIVAMTAHAMVGDRERCLAAGMDDYVSKPIQPDELFRALERTIDIAQGNSKMTGEPPIDLDFALTRVEGDMQLLREIAGLFGEECRRLMDNLQSALDNSDAKTVEKIAHTMKGMLGNFGAKGAIEASLTLERFAKQADMEKSMTAYSNLESALELIRPFIAKLALEEAA